MPAYLVLLQMEVTAFHRNLIRSSLWPYSSPHGGRPLTVIPLYAARTFLPSLRERRLSSQLHMYSNTPRHHSPAAAPAMLQKIGRFQRGLSETARVFPVKYMR